MNKDVYMKKHSLLMKAFCEAELHKNEPFINKDGIIDLDEWVNTDPKILFILKEAYHSEGYSQNEHYDLADDLKSNGPWNGIWNNISNWIYAILNTTTHYLADYKDVYEMTKESSNNLLRKAAVINIKKSNGKSTSNDEELKRYANSDKELLKRQIELISPDVIV